MIPAPRSGAHPQGSDRPARQEDASRLLDVHSRDRPADDEPLDLAGALEDGEGLSGLSGRVPDVPY
jgi:hypothetical protein